MLGADLAAALPSPGCRGAQVGISDPGGLGGVVMAVDQGDALAQQAGAGVEQGGQDPAATSPEGAAVILYVTLVASSWR